MPLPRDLLGCDVEITSENGIAYQGKVVRVQPPTELGELFELGSGPNGAYRRLVFVTDREKQIRLGDGRR